MKIPRFVWSLFVLVGLVGAALAGEATGTWQWSTHTPNGDIATTLKLEAKDGKLTGAYANQFGNTTISNGSLTGDTLNFDVVRDFGGKKYVVHYHGKLAGDTIQGTIEAPGHDGGKPVTLEWTAHRASTDRTPDSQPKS